MERRLIERSLEDDAFRQQRLADPKAVVERELGARLPSWITVQAVEETPKTDYLVIPPSSPAEGDELSDRDLASVAGGGTWTDNTCGGQSACGCDPTAAASRSLC